MNKSIYKLAVLGFFGLGISAYAQTENYKGKVGVNTQQPNATLDVVAKNNTGATIEGLKTPELTGDALKAMTTLLTEKNNGLVVFVTSAVSEADASTTAVTVPGYYRFNVTEYKKGIETSEGSPKLYTERTWVRMEPTGLEFVVENGKGGRRLVGADATKYGDIGQLAVDMSHQTGEKIPYTTVNSEGKTVYTYHDIITEGNAILTQIGATGDYSFVANTDNTASGQRASAFGYRAVATGSTSFAAGHTNVAEGNQSATFGYRNYTKGTNSAAFGQANYAEANNSAAFGQGNTAKGDRSVVFGQTSEVTFSEKQTSYTSRNSVAMGTGVIIKDSPNSLAYGAGTNITNSQNAFAGGASAGTVKINDVEVVFEPTKIVNGNSSIALGASIYLKGNGSVGLGSRNEVNGNGSIAIGIGSKVGSFDAAAGVNNSIAIGAGTTVTGARAVAIGSGASATVNDEVAIGNGSSSSVVLGKLKRESISIGGTCTDNGKLSYNGTDFLGCTGGTWKKLNN